MRKRRKALDASDDNIKVKYQRRQDKPKSPNQSDEEAVLLENVIEDDCDDGLYHREVIR